MPATTTPSPVGERHGRQGHADGECLAVGQHHHLRSDTGLIHIDRRHSLDSRQLRVHRASDLAERRHRRTERIFTPTDASNYNTVTSTVNVTVDKATPTVSTWPSASTITYGQTLASSTLTGGTASIPGSFAFTTPATSPNAGTAAQSVTFTPTDTTNYNTVTSTVNVTVDKATPTVSTWPSASTITYGQTLASSTLTGGTASIPGSFAFTAPATSPNAGTAAQSATFTPTDASNYNTVTNTVNVTVDKATPTVSTWPSASTITYGQTLASSTLTGGTASIPGSFAFTAPSTSPNAGTAAQSVTFTPTDASNYNTVTNTVNVTVDKATPTVSAWPSASTITYGQTLASSTLTGGTASIPGSFAFTAPATSPNAGTSAQSVTFTPTDTTNYNTVVSTVNVTVDKATPTVSAWPSASTLNYGQTLASSTLTGGTASIPGSFAFTAPATSPNAGTAAQSVTFTPTDASNYNTVTNTVNVTVDKATPTVSTWPSASTITYGQTLASSTLTGGTASIPGSFAFTTPSTSPNAGTAAQSVTFTPTDASNYNTVTNTVNVTVDKATPTVSAWPSASTITYGQTLASSTLTGGTASIPGSFAFTTPSTSPNAGTAAQSVTFTPTDASNYNTVANSVNVTVSKAAATVDLSSLSQTYTGLALSATAATNPVGLSVAVTYDGSTIPPTSAGTYVVIGTINDANYQGSSTGTLIIAKATPTVSAWPTASSISYGQTLASSNLTGGIASVSGNFTFTTISNSPNAGTAAQGVIFTPTDATNYNTVAGIVDVSVDKATPTVSAWPLASTITYGQTLASSTLTGGSASVLGSFTFAVLRARPALVQPPNPLYLLRPISRTTTPSPAS